MHETSDIGFDVFEILFYLVDLISHIIFHVLNLSSQHVLLSKKSERQAAGYLRPRRTDKYISSEHHRYIIENLRLVKIRAAMISSLGPDGKVL